MMKTTIIADLKKYAQELPEKPAVSDKSVQLTYAELLAKVQRETVILQEHGVTCADKIAVLAISKVDYVISYLAVQYLGAISVISIWLEVGIKILCLKSLWDQKRSVVQK